MFLFRNRCSTRYRLYNFIKTLNSVYESGSLIAKIENAQQQTVEHFRINFLRTSYHHLFKVFGAFV